MLVYFLHGLFFLAQNYSATNTLIYCLPEGNQHIQVSHSYNIQFTKSFRLKKGK